MSAGASVRVEVENGVVMSSTLNADSADLRVHHNDGHEWFVLHVAHHRDRESGPSFEVYEIVGCDAESSIPGNFIYELRLAFSMPDHPTSPHRAGSE